MINRSLAPSASRQTGKSLAHRIALPVLWALSLTGLGLQPTQAIEITNQLVSVGVPGDTGNAESTPQALSSADGRYSLFSSQATNLVDGVEDVNSASDVFLYDRVADRLTLVSHAAESTAFTASGGSTPIAISADGEWVLFSSFAGNLVAGVIDSNSVDDAFVYQRSTGTVTLISRSASSATATANGSSYPTAISANGEWVLFRSDATNLVAGSTDSNSASDVFLYQRSTGAVSLVSRSSNSSKITANDRSYPNSISADGEWVLFYSYATDVVVGVADDNGQSDTFLYQRSKGAMSLISRSASSAITTANAGSYGGPMTLDGEWIVFMSGATDVVGGVIDHNSENDAFLYQRSSGDVRLISRSASNATITSNRRSYVTAISADGEWVLFASFSSNLVAGVSDSNETQDAFLYQRSGGIVSLVSHSSSSATTAANSGSYPSEISADGEWLLFSSSATNVGSGVVDSNQAVDTFLYQRSSGEARLITRSASSTTTTANGGSVGNAISADGEWVLLASDATNLMAGVIDSNGGYGTDVFLYRRSSGEFTLVSRTNSSAIPTPNGSSMPAAVSADGKWVLFSSSATSLIEGVVDANVSGTDVFLFQRSSGTIQLVSRAATSPTTTANGDSSPIAVSADGEWVLFASNATNLVEGMVDNNGPFGDAFLYRRRTGEVRLVSHSVSSTVTTASAGSNPKAISADGEWVLFESAAPEMVSGVTDSNFATDVYLYQRSTGTVSLVSHSSSSPTTTANYYSFATGISADGEWVLFQSFATDVVPGQIDSNGTYDVFVYQRSTGEVSLVSHSDDSATTTANSESQPTAISPDGEWVLFSSYAGNLVAGVDDNNGSNDVFLYQRGTGAVRLISRSASNQTMTANNQSYSTGISADGEWVLFASIASDLAAGSTDSNGTEDVFLYQRSSGEVSLVSRSASSTSAAANGHSYPAGISADGEWVLFYSRASDVMAGVIDNNDDAGDVFLYQRSVGTISLISCSASSAITTANHDSSPTAISADGGSVLFGSLASDVAPGVVDDNEGGDVFLARIGFFADGFEGQQ